MEYRMLAENFLNTMYKLGKRKRYKDVAANMRGEGFAVLYLIMSDKPVTPGELKTAMQISSARVAAMLNTMEKKELIVREIDSDDRRKILVRLTEKGKEKAENCRLFSLKCTEVMMEKLGEEDAGHLVRIMDKMTEILDVLPEMECIEEETENVIKD